jgi:hypothetical protein
LAQCRHRLAFIACRSDDQHPILTSVVESSFFLGGEFLAGGDAAVGVFLGEVEAGVDDSSGLASGFGGIDKLG